MACIIVTFTLLISGLSCERFVQLLLLLSLLPSPLIDAPKTVQLTVPLELKYFFSLFNRTCVKQTVFNCLFSQTDSNCLL